MRHIELFNNWELFNEEVKMKLITTFFYHLEHNTFIIACLLILVATNIVIWIDSNSKWREIFNNQERKWDKEDESQK